jgi:hypothetical protein
MGAPRKKWSTRTTPGAAYKRHDSKTAAYRYVERMAEEFRLGMLHGDLVRVSVYVDEGNGVQLYETVDLANVPAVEP